VPESAKERQGVAALCAGRLDAGGYVRVIAPALTEFADIARGGKIE